MCDTHIDLVHVVLDMWVTQRREHVCLLSIGICPTIVIRVILRSKVDVQRWHIVVVTCGPQRRIHAVLEGKTMLRRKQRKRDGAVRLYKVLLHAKALQGKNCHVDCRSADVMMLWLN